MKIPLGKLLVIAVLALAATALLVAGCGGDDDDNEKTTPAATTGGGQTLQVTATEYKFDPANPSIDKTGRVTFDVKNEGNVVHALEIEAPSGEAQTGNIDPGQSKSVTVDLSKAGSFEWYCPVGNHRDLGMEGEIRVAGGGSTTTEDRDSTTNGGGSTTEDSGKTEDSGGGTTTNETGGAEDESGSDDSGGSNGTGGSGY
jgi:uncharacterized cupredoxin-like copper-binding protein